MTKIRLIVGLITSHCTYLTITKRPELGCSAIDDDIQIESNNGEIQLQNIINKDGSNGFQRKEPSKIQDHKG
jgi:shikimate kinase